MVVNCLSEISEVQNKRNNETLYDTAVRLRNSGMTYQEIADKLNISKSKAWRLLNKNGDRREETSDLRVSRPPIEEPLPFEPTEVLGDAELKLLDKRLSRELAIERKKARLVYLKEAQGNPSLFRSRTSKTEMDKLRDEISTLRKEIRDSKSSKADSWFEKLIITKALGNPGMDAKEVVAFAGQLKALLGSDQDFMQQYLGLKQLEKSGIAEYQKMEDQAFQKAKAQVDKNLISKVAEKGLEVAKGVAEGLAKGNIQMPQMMPPPPTRELSEEELAQKVLPPEATTNQTKQDSKKTKKKGKRSDILREDEF